MANRPIIWLITFLHHELLMNNVFNFCQFPVGRSTRQKGCQHSGSFSLNLKPTTLSLFQSVGGSIGQEHGSPLSWPYPAGTILDPWSSSGSWGRTLTLSGPIPASSEAGGPGQGFRSWCLPWLLRRNSSPSSCFLTKNETRLNSDSWANKKRLNNPRQRERERERVWVSRDRFSTRTPKNAWPLRFHLILDSLENKKRLKTPNRMF